MNKIDPTKCVVTINLSHSADAVLRKSEVTRVGVAGRLGHLECKPTQVVCCIRPVLLQRRKTL